MESQQESFNMWPSRQRSVPEVSIINGVSTEPPAAHNSSNDFSNIPSRLMFPLCSSPPLRDYTSKAVQDFDKVTPDLNAFKTDLLIKLKQERRTEMDDLLTNIKQENTQNMNDLKLQLERTKYEIGHMFKKQDEKMCILFENLLEAFKSCEVADVKKDTVDESVQVSLVTQDVDVQTDDFSDQEVVIAQIPKTTNISPPERTKKSPTASPSGNHQDSPRLATRPQFEEVEESDEERRVLEERDGRRQWLPPLDQPPVNGWQNVSPYARNLRQVALKPQGSPVVPAHCTDVTLAADAMCAKYLPPEALAQVPYSSPSPAPPPARPREPLESRIPPTKDVVFNMTNVSLAMRCPATRKEAEPYPWPYPHQQRPVPMPEPRVNGYHRTPTRDDEYYYHLDQMRNCLADYWQPHNGGPWDPRNQEAYRPRYPRPQQEYPRRDIDLGEYDPRNQVFEEDAEAEYQRRAPAGLNQDYPRRAAGGGNQVYPEYQPRAGAQEYPNDGIRRVAGVEQVFQDYANGEAGGHQRFEEEQSPVLRGRVDRLRGDCRDRILDVSAIMNQPKLQ